MSWKRLKYSAEPRGAVELGGDAPAVFAATGDIVTARVVV